MLDIIKNLLWNYLFVPMFLVVGGVSLYWIIRHKGAQRCPSDRKKGEVSPLQTLFVNLASTIGTGNIIGVSLAISAGGPGAVFWMWIAAFFGMAVSYCENSLGIKYRSDKKLIGYMPGGVAKLFASFCILASFGIGNMIQSNSAANALFEGFGAEKWITGIVFSVLAFIIIKGGLKGITKFTDFFVPVMGAFYLVASIVVIGINYSELSSVIKSIFTEAFSPRAIGGGALATGIARGVMSGEAGVGSTVILSSRSDAKSPHAQGVVGAMSVFIDTIVICTFTALAILSSNSVSAQSAFYSTLGTLGGMILDVSIAFFAFTTIVGWSYFGIECTGFLFGEKKKDIYKLIYALLVFAGAVAELDIVWGIGDISCVLMALPNLICVMLLAKNINFKGTSD